MAFGCDGKLWGKKPGNTFCLSGTQQQRMGEEPLVNIWKLLIQNDNKVKAAGPQQITCQVWNAEISEDREFLNTQECTITLLTQHLEGFQFYFCRFSGCRFCLHGVWWFQLFSEKGCLLLLVDIKLIDEWKLEWTNRIELRDLKLEQWAIKKVKKISKRLNGPKEKKKKGKNSLRINI